MISADDIVTKAGHLLQDDDHDRWTVAELLSWIGEAGVEVVTIDHSAGATVEEVELAEGVVQVIDAVEVMDVVRNLPTGKPVYRTERYMLDASAPEWYAMTPGSTIKQWAIDDRDKATIYVYPPAQAGAKVEALVSKLPAAPAEGGSLGIGAEYTSAVINYVLYRAMSKDFEYGNGAAATSYYQAFQASMGNNVGGSDAVSPNPQRTGAAQ